MEIKKYNEFDKTNEEMSSDVKEFIGYWDPKDFEVQPGCGQGKGFEVTKFTSNDEIFPSEENGYSLDEIEEVNELEIGEVYSAVNYGNRHMILRVK